MEPGVIETVLTEVLEEQKQVNSKLSSFTAVLMEMHESKTNSKDSVSDKLSDRLGTVQTALQALPEQINTLMEEIRQLRDSLERCRQQLKQPIRQVVKHHVSKIWMVAAGLFLGSVTLLYFLFDTSHKLDLYKAGDIKYRHLKTINRSDLQRLLFYTDSLYRMRPDSFVQAVEIKEEQEKLQIELLQQAVQKEKEAKQLRKRAGEQQP